jgi:hypothetical protein
MWTFPESDLKYSLDAAVIAVSAFFAMASTHSPSMTAEDRFVSSTIRSDLVLLPVGCRDLDVGVAAGSAPPLEGRDAE